MDKKINWTEIVNLAGQMHNNLQEKSVPVDKKQEQDTICKILELLGVDIDKIYAICDEIDGCCFEIAQNETITKKHLLQENECIDKCSSNLRYMFDDITGSY